VVIWCLITFTSRHDKEVAVAQNTNSSPQCQFASVREQLQSSAGLPFLAFLSKAAVEAACRSCNYLWRDRIYTPWITLSVFLSQILSDDQSCDDAIDRFQKYREDQGLDPVSSESTSYCDARQRLAESVVWELMRRTGKAILDHAKPTWLFHKRHVKIIDGTTVSMPDTPENQKEYPQSTSQAPGLGFPIARILVIFSLAVGTVLDAAVKPYQGKETSELALLRSLMRHFQPGDIALGDRLFSSYWAIADFQRHGVDVVMRLHQSRKADFRRGRRLGRKDRLFVWTKPKQRPKWMTPEEYDAMPAELTVRILHVQVQGKTKRVRELVIVTTLVDAKTYSSEEIGDLYRQRWHGELDLRSLKTAMHMEELRTKSPAMVRKEIAMHFLAYNLIRGLISEAARVAEVAPRTISFKGSVHTIRAFEEAHLYDPSRIEADLPRLLELIVRKRVGDRPDRYEPRAVKRRPKPHPRLTIPRKKARQRIEKGEMLYERT
jgi:Transposase DDE domain